ncbi:hypothetical protein BSZ39_10615 [Bowdeniella nasicola]|uniref:Uncharacterized protein n=1 Tax=Bowdeniella nasicola TaxID=208480 RepID=A0A1Q5Q0B5_9ACTO|nr:hypothetical protein [Bowdeniella nasicola]OKL53227.1 hypothetical protein BSZ39_10615 [Bowdeniella nasicola]
MILFALVAAAWLIWVIPHLKEPKHVPPETRELQAEINKTYTRRAWVSFGITAPALALAWVLIWWGQQVQLANSYTSEATVPSYEYRAPFVVAEQLANRDLDDVIGDRAGVHAVQTEKTPNQYTSLVIRRGIFEGYEPVQMIQSPLVGAKNQTSNACRFDPAHKLRLGGWAPTDNLGYWLSFQRPFSFWDNEDAYGFCDGDEPVVVVPLKRLGGFWPVVTEHPDGAAVYRGGRLTVYGAGEIPSEIVGPTYPRSIAAAQRSSSVASASFMDWIFKRAGYDTAGETRDDEDSSGEPNAANALDFSLISNGGKGEYVTALTPVGVSESVVALGHVSNRQEGPGLNPYVVSRYPEALPALSTSENRIRSGFNQLPSWASGMRVMEITPAADGNYVVSIGQNQVVTYRMVIAQNGAVSLLDQVGAAPAPPKEGEGDPTKLSTEEVQRRIKEYIDELAKRADGYSDNAA